MTCKSIGQLLKSSLPLEQHVAEVAFKNGLLSRGEFPYLRKTELGIETEFSVDILATANHTPKSGIHTSVEVNALIECKYASQNVEWIFSTAPNHQPSVYSSVSIFNWLSPHVLAKHDGLDDIEPKDFCIRGVSLSDTSADPKPIKHGLQQLRHAIPHLLDMVTTLYTTIYDEHPIPVVAPMLVTNAPLRLLKTGVTIEEIKRCNNIEEISDLKDIITCYQPAGPELLEICQSLSKKIWDKYAKEKKVDSSEILFSDMVQSVESIPIVSVNYLETYLQGMRDAFTKNKAMLLTELCAQIVGAGNADQKT